MKKYLLPLLFAASSAFADDIPASAWTPAQLGLGAAALALLAVDTRQTLDISKLRAQPRQGDTMRESNPLLGTHPSDRKVKTYFSTVAVAQFVLLGNLSSNVRTGTLVGLVTLQIGCTAHNHSIGLSGRF